MTNTKPVLAVIIGSVRPGRVGKPVADWIADRVAEDGRFEVRVLDLAEINLPLLDEPNPPMMQKYTKQHTKDWSATISGVDAALFVTPEYNHAYPASLKNAIDFLAAEWQHLPAAVASYGNLSAGLRAAAKLVDLMTVMRMMVIKQAVAVPNVGEFVNDGIFEGNDNVKSSLTEVLAELERVLPAARLLGREGSAA